MDLRIHRYIMASIDEISHLDILQSFSSKDKNDTNEYIATYKEYKRVFPVLGYYRIIMPYEYLTELEINAQIRFSESTKYISSAHRIKEIHKNPLTGQIEYLVAKKMVDPRAVDHDDISHLIEIKIHPDMYYIFRYDPSGTTKFNRSLRKMGVDPDNEDESRKRFSEIIQENAGKKHAKARVTTSTPKRNSRIQGLLDEYDDRK